MLLIESRTRQVNVSVYRAAVTVSTSNDENDDDDDDDSHESKPSRFQVYS